jgi:glutaredoxin-related protein
MVITENWCGDSAQNLPYLAKISKLNNNIKLRIILRDSHPEIMDSYLTNGTRSIPKLVVFDAEGNERFSWGPRPMEVQKLFSQWKAEGIVKPELYEKLHLWYSKDKGKSIEKEILQLIQSLNLEVV